MKMIDPYRDPREVQRLQNEIAQTVTRPWVLMEVCGGQTHSILKYGLDELLPPEVTLIHGPGCPVCVTPVETLDTAQAIASEPGVIFCSFGDMLRVPGTSGDLLTRKAQGADLRVVYSPLDAVKLAERNPSRPVVLFAIGFETTAPANAMAVKLARDCRLRNFSALVSQVRVPPAVAAILASPRTRVQGLLGPGHVCTVTGYVEYEQLAERFGVPVAITGFEPTDILDGVRRCLSRLESGQCGVENQYARAVSRDGNVASRRLLDEVFEVCDRSWRGIGVIPASGYRLRDEYREYDAEARFSVTHSAVDLPTVCISGQILTGEKRPTDCPAFGRECTPRTPLGATMVSSEGACAAYHAYGRSPREVRT